MQTNLTLPASGRCDQSVAAHSLLAHPFYVAWSAGTLPVEALRDYAREYGAFIRTIGQGWAVAGEAAIAQIEEAHARIWEQSFAQGLGTSVTPPAVGEVADLVHLSEALFADRVTALGALYAFEAQQPHTSQSKLQGLREHYAQLGAASGEYFRIHADDYDEPALLARSMDDLSPADQARAVDACERMSRALYDALTGIYAPFAPMACD